MDILGFSSIIEKTRQDDELRMRVEELLVLYHEIMIKPDLENNNIRDRQARKITSFSDNIVISYSINVSFLEAIYDLCSLQVLALNKGFLVRGGITIGDVRHVEKTLFGPGFIEAYRLESEVSIFPRVIFTQKTLTEAFDKDMKVELTKEDDERFIKKNLCKKDYDGLFYLDFLNDYIVAKSIIDKDDYIMKLVKIIDDNKNITNAKVKQKYDWLKTKVEDCLLEWSKSAQVIENNRK